MGAFMFDVRVVLGLASAFLKDALVTAASRVKAGAETLPGSVAIYVAALVLTLWGTTAIVVTAPIGYIVWVLAVTAGFSVVFRNLPFMRAQRRRHKALLEEAAKSRIDAAECLAYWQGRGDGFKAARSLYERPFDQERA